MAEHNHTVVSDLDRMQALVKNLSAYIEQYHGGSVELVSFDGKILEVRLGGACDGCALSATTLRGWVGGTVKQFFPEVEVVQSLVS
ncbi:MAG: NifU family protein [Anaerolineae bacterium]|nr:NifU family protein [Anaerolineae bacterium]